MMTIRSKGGRDVLRQLGRVTLASFLVLYLGLSFVGSSVPVARAQILPDPLNTNTSGSQAINVPKYSGVESSISSYLCVPSDSSVGTALYDCISKGYRFGIAFGAIALVFFVVFAGYMYMVGGETGKQKGKSIFLSAITGMALILSSYVLLSFINPELTKIKIIQPPVFDAGNLPSCSDIGFQGACVLPSGDVQVNSTGVAGSAAEAKYAALIQKYATLRGVPYCSLSALINQESSFNRLAYSNPSGVINESAGPPSYGLSFGKFHAIGLTQVTIYPQSDGGWVGSTPARSDKADFGTSPLTMQMLMDPETNIAAGSNFFANLYNNHGQSVKVAYQAYFNGEGGANKPAPVDLTVKYNACLARGTK